MDNGSRNRMPIQDPSVRKNNFDEVTLGYDEETAVKEAQRCLNCKNRPCTSACPVSIKIPDFIHKIANRDFEGAYQIILEDSSLPAICGRVCPQEKQCEGKCIRGIKGDAVAIGRLERFVADWHNKKEVVLQQIHDNGHKIAIIGSGPSGLSCAGDLVKSGFRVTVYEALHEFGGVLAYGIPEFRLPKSVLKREIDNLRLLGVKFEKNVIVGKSVTIDELLENFGFEAVYIGTGAGLPRFMNIPGESLCGVYSANEFLTRVNLMKAYKNADTPVKRGHQVIVVGGGNVAMDAARCAIRLGADTVRIVYRRSMEELPARKEEVIHAQEEGILFEMLTEPISINGKDSNFVQSITCQKMKLGEPDDSGRRKPIPIEGEIFDMDADCVIMAIGTSPNPLISRSTKELETEAWGGIICEKETGKTTKENVYAGGDAVTGSATVILAMEAGKKAAEAIKRKFE